MSTRHFIQVKAQSKKTKNENPIFPPISAFYFEGEYCYISVVVTAAFLILNCDSGGDLYACSTWDKHFLTLCKLVYPASQVAVGFVAAPPERGFGFYVIHYPAHCER